MKFYLVEITVSNYLSHGTMLIAVSRLEESAP